MRKEPSGRIFANAIQFYELAKPAFESDAILEKNVMAVICNLALCVELLLKCSDAGVKKSPFRPGGLLGDAQIYSNVWGHDLEKIFNNLDLAIREKLAELYKQSTGADLKPTLVKCKDYFIHARYAHDSKSRHSFNVSAIKELADGLIKSINSWHSA